MKQQEFGTAREFSEEARQGGNPAGASGLGRLYMQQQEFGTARELFEEALF